jgi:hypothetical protein
MTTSNNNNKLKMRPRTGMDIKKVTKRRFSLNYTENIKI